MHANTTSSGSEFHSFISYRFNLQVYSKTYLSFLVLSTECSSETHGSAAFLWVFRERCRRR